MQIVSMNPGGVLTQSARDSGYAEDSYPWNSRKSSSTSLLRRTDVVGVADLPGQFAVWLASPEASFLHGRFVWTEWDVESLKSGPIRQRIDADPNYLKIGVRGI